MSAESFIETLKKGIEIITPPQGLEEKLALSQKEKRPLVVKLGFDPTAPDLHLGHAVVLRKLKTFQDAGHKVVIIIGDFTARIGDPTGRNKARPPLTEEEIQINAKTYFEQLGRLLDLDKIEIRGNASWLAPMDFAEVLKLLSKATVAQIMQREDFKNRFESGTPIGLHEILYPLMQGQDSLAIGADIEMGGTDQLFNCQMGRALQEAEGLPAQIVLSMPLLVGLDGKEKMSKSKNNTIGIIDAPREKFGKAMSIPDEALPSWLDLTTTFEEKKKEALKEGLATGTLHPMEVKKEMAQNIVSQFDGDEAAQDARAFFENQFQKKENLTYEERKAKEVFGAEKGLSVLALCAKLLPDLSKSEVKRLITSGAVSLEETKCCSPLEIVSAPEKAPLHIKIGKRGFYEIITE